MNENQITLTTDEGTEELATILFTHEANGNNYVVFELVESGDISAARYVEGEDGTGEILDIDTDEEWQMLDKLLDEYFDDLEDEEEELEEEIDE